MALGFWEWAYQINVYMVKMLWCGFELIEGRLGVGLDF